MGNESASLFGTPEPTSFPKPRPFQDKAHNALREGYRNKHKNQLICASTGAGKTILGMRVIYEGIRKGKRAAFICDRKTLINQTSDVADKLGIPHGVIQADHWRVDKDKPFQIASIQTLARRKWPHFDIIVVDEAHAMYTAWTEVALNTDAAVIGLTATPFTRGLGKYFSNLIMAATMDELTRDGYLVPLRVFSCRKPDMTGAETSGGEWTDRAAEEREMAIVGDVVTEWMKHGEDRKTICFGATINHCEELCKRFNESGVMAAVYTSRTTDEQRADILEAFDDLDGPLKVLISVVALAKGFDRPYVSCICDARPLRKSLSECIQMWGRGVRIAPNIGKKDCLLLDFSGNIIRFAADFEDFYFNGISKLDDAEKLDQSIRKDEPKSECACPQCGHVPFVRRCVACGHEKKMLSMVKELPGDMREITIGKTKAADNATHLWAQIVTYCSSVGNPMTINGRAAHLYRDIMGQYPPRHFNIDIPPVEVSKAIINKVRSRQIAYAKATGRR